jgi:hypothetical protein
MTGFTPPDELTMIVSAGLVTPFNDAVQEVPLDDAVPEDVKSPADEIDR